MAAGFKPVMPLAPKGFAPSRMAAGGLFFGRQALAGVALDVVDSLLAGLDDYDIVDTFRG